MASVFQDWRQGRVAKRYSKLTAGRACRGRRPARSLFGPCPVPSPRLRSPPGPAAMFMRPRPPQGMPRRPGTPALSFPSRLAPRSQSGLAGRHCRGRAARHRASGRSAPWPATRRPAQMTGGQAAGPGPPPAPRRPAAPPRQDRPHPQAAASCRNAHKTATATRCPPGSRILIPHTCLHRGGLLVRGQQVHRPLHVRRARPGVGVPWPAWPPWRGRSGDPRRPGPSPWRRSAGRRRAGACPSQALIAPR